MEIVLTPALLRAAYEQGLFPMAFGADSPYLQWICPEKRGQLSITGMHISRSLKKQIRKAGYEITTDTAFSEVIRFCAQKRETRPETWINHAIIEGFEGLHAQGLAHSVEYRENGQLRGGLYGLALGGAFFGESMFSERTAASKIALVHLAARLWRGGFMMLDTQFTNAHLEQFGVFEVAHEAYMKELQSALKIHADFKLPGLSEAQILEDYFAMRAEFTK